MSYLHFRIASTCVDSFPSHPPYFTSTSSPSTTWSSMSPQRDTWYSASPTIFSPPPPPPSMPQSHLQLPLQLPSQPPHIASSASPSPSSRGISMASTPTPSTFNMPMRPHAGRKRSRDEVSGTLDEPNPHHLAGDDHDPTIDRPPSPPKRPAVAPVYGPGMTLIYPGESAYSRDAASQSGTWVEERDELAATRPRGSSKTGCTTPAALPNEDRPVLESRKSQRFNGDAPGLDDIARAIAIQPPRSNISEPVIDEATLTLGIGWTVMSNEMEAATRGWSRFIENHYPLQSVRLFWQNKSLPAYLATAVCYGAPGYYLFDEDLDRCQMVAKSWERALDNLRSTPPAFDGAQVLTARRSGGGAVVNGVGMVNGNGSANGHENADGMNGMNGMNGNGINGVNGLHVLSASKPGAVLEQDSGMDLD